MRLVLAIEAVNKDIKKQKKKSSDNHAHNILRLLDILDKHGIYELHYELPNYLRFRVLEIGKYKKMTKLDIIKA